MPTARVVAVVVTYNRKEMLVECLEALARQTHSLAGVMVVDSASTDGTEERVIASGVAERLPLRYLRLGRNGGASEGFHYGFEAALEEESDWLWVMDDDCAPAADGLAELLAAPRAQDPDAAVLAPLVVGAEGQVLPLNRGVLRRRWLLGPLVALSPEEYARPEHPIELCSWPGSLVRTVRARELGLPMRELFIRLDDVEYYSRLRGRADGGMWLIPASRMVHKDLQPLAGTDVRTLWRDWSAPTPFAQQWKRLYGLRNLFHIGRRDGYVDRASLLSLVLVNAVRIALFDERRARSLALLALYARDGWRGVFRNVPPHRWAALADAPALRAAIAAAALSYEAPTPVEPRLLTRPETSVAAGAA